jgi:choline-sulfatase
VLFVMLALAILGCEVSPTPPSALLITLDTTRTDALGCYGGERAHTPVLDALARESLRFTQAITTAPYTGPSHASMLTGLFPPQHGLRDFLHQRLPERMTTLAEILQQAGFETAAFISAYPLARRYGLDQGFDVYSDRAFGPAAKREQAKQFQRRADDTVDEALAWLRGRNRERPFFAWIHLYDPHWPYDPPEAYRRPAAPDATQEMQQRYYEEVTYMDAQVGRLLGVLAELGLQRELLIIVVADHGELKGHHGRLQRGHSPVLVDAVVRVPLLVRVPGRAGVVVDHQVRVLDIFATVLEVLGQPVPAGTESRSLLAIDPAEPPRLAYSETFYEHYPERAGRGQELVSVRQGGWKLILRPGREELFSLTDDPAELRNRTPSDSQQLADLRAALRVLQARWPARLLPQPLELSGEAEREHLERLRALGYVK